jgi:DNA primase catalytic subunit
MKMKLEIEEKTFQLIQQKLESYDRLMAIAEAMAAELAPLEYEDGAPRIDLDKNEMKELKRMDDVFDEDTKRLSESAATELSKCVCVPIAQDIMEKLEEFLRAQSAHRPVDFSCVLDFENFKIGFK